ncbi:bifunctional methylenetetrahydrofolate dehydrogenase/methenyltetrahydrofolate cyclohydrolase FolD [Tunicatimonas pelagia]|uniref:bifunctional methylenetetrahydrofolate dehydrogenase/methenyltetrahydrofolate cyclohydrolase FolD n=1 Tax=Tunicatimonas pelagia TaxID=931531 RepID=UPI002666FF28|nr:bifunctional methylenetetrahydrofolate dehydrogenase/methenyltetrahydrofolate cyclohydrolase FolD [Tunicatimonas pelagia]WKN44716.1 bifunctional methylenetetrahydrofolate dehydrogenase/methenyltetrahydrofolate cyclohydrolase FolD [Tunicatimonas pelagia]
MTIIDGKQTAQQIRQELTEQVNQLKAEGKKVPHLAAVLVGNDTASETYVRNKVKDCEQVGFNSTLVRLDESISEEELLQEVHKLNDNPDVDGFIVQLPLPNHINDEKITFAIKAEKDVDGFHPINVGRMAKGLPSYVAATPLGIMQLLERYQIETESKHCVVIGRSDIVGTPMSLLMSRKSNPGNSTVTICHSRTKNMAEITREADILIAAIGKAHFVTADMVKEGAVVIDVGINRVNAPERPRGYKLVGDVHFEEVTEKCSYITPVPGGVGPMTRAALLYNAMLAAKKEIYR